VTQLTVNDDLLSPDPTAVEISSGPVAAPLGTTTVNSSCVMTVAWRTRRCRKSRSSLE